MSANSDNRSEKRSLASRGTVYSAEKSLYVKQLLKLKQHEDILGRNFTAAIDSIKLEKNIVQDIIQDCKELSMKRNKFVNTLRENVNDIMSELEDLKCVINNTENIKKLDVNTYKLKLIKLSQKMYYFKNHYSTQSLIEEQTALEAELREYEPNLAKYENMQKYIASLLTCQNRAGSKKEWQDYKNVEDFHSLVAKTGHTENWSMEDHLFFLKIRKKCENIPALVTAIQERCPDISAEKIVNHEAWYKLYENLREKQKSAVKEWRKQKEDEKTKNIEKIYNIENCFEENNLLNEYNEVKEKRRTEIPKKMKTHRAKTKSASSADSNNSIKKELIKKWRLEKENKRAMDEEQIKTQTKMKREIEESRKRKRQEKIREALREYKEKKSVDCTSMESNERLKEKYSTALIKDFRKQDAEYVKRRKNLLLRSQQTNNDAVISVNKLELFNIPL